MIKYTALTTHLKVDDVKNWLIKINMAQPLHCLLNLHAERIFSIVQKI